LRSILILQLSIVTNEWGLKAKIIISMANKASADIEIKQLKEKIKIIDE